MTKTKIPADVRPYFETLMRIPADVRLSMATREFDMALPFACVCGWAIREELIALRGTDEHPDPWNAPDPAEGWPDDMAKTFGGSVAEWDRVFMGACRSHTLPSIELAYVFALDAAVEGR